MSRTVDPRQVFISFKTKERVVADRLQHALGHRGYNVWWQEKLQCGQEWHGEIDAALETAGCVVVLWSNASQDSPWVKHEASQAIARGVYAPARIEALKIDSPFDRFQATDLIEWTGEDSHPGFQNLLRRIEQLLPPVLSPWERAVRVARRNLVAIGLLAFATVSVALLLKLGAAAKEQIAEQLRASQRLQESEKSLASLITRTDKLIEPELRFAYVLSIGAKSGGHFSLENSGGGMATITAIRAQLDGQTISTDAASLSAVGAQFDLVGQTLNVGETIGPGKAVKIFDIPAKLIEPSQVCKRDKERKGFFERLQLDVDYVSLLGTAKTKKFEYISSNKLRC